MLVAKHQNPDLSRMFVVDGIEHDGSGDDGGGSVQPAK
jgi:hypothetical protein